MLKSTRSKESATERPCAGEMSVVAPGGVEVIQTVLLDLSRKGISYYILPAK